MSEMQIKPNTFILGAPKCGTTTLYSWLSQHPEVCFSKSKEPHYFYSPYKNKITLDEYEANFSHASSEHKVICEASVWYLFSETAVPKILDFQPDAKFIVCVRNPIDMAQSLHAQTVFSGYELVKDFTSAWKLNNQRLNGSMDGVYGLYPKNQTRMSYMHACSLGSQINTLLSQTERDRIHFIVLDDMKSNPSVVWNSLLSFLELNKFESIKYEAKNPATVRRSIALLRLSFLIKELKSLLNINFKSGLLSPLFNWNRKEMSYPKISNEFRLELKHEFRGQIGMLENILERNFHDWIK